MKDRISKLAAFSRNRNAIACMLRRLMDFRRIAARCDRLAENALAAVYLAAAVGHRL